MKLNNPTEVLATSFHIFTINISQQYQVLALMCFLFPLWVSHHFPISYFPYEFLIIFLWFSPRSGAGVGVGMLMGVLGIPLLENKNMFFCILIVCIFIFSFVLTCYSYFISYLHLFRLLLSIFYFVILDISNTKTVGSRISKNLQTFRCPNWQT